MEDTYNLIYVWFGNHFKGKKENEKSESKE